MCRVQLIWLVVALVCSLAMSQKRLRQNPPSEGNDKNEGKGTSDALKELGLDYKAQKSAVRAWAKSLEETDYSPKHWHDTMNKMPSNFFEHYVAKLSDLFLGKGAIVNFALVGACDGTNDRTIKDRYLVNQHWRGVFVEPFEMNYNDLNNFMQTHGVSDRTFTIHAAATRKCNDTYIKMKRPTFEERNKSLPHWMRRQIGAVVPHNKLDRPMTGGWVAEFTRCVTGEDILKDWAVELRRKAGLEENSETADDETAAGGGKKKKKKSQKVRPHILKVDVEGHDYEVLMGFLKFKVPNAELPLLISFEAKSITDKFEALKDHMEKRGYVVSDYATDGFALLRGDKLFKQKGGKKGGGKKKKKSTKND